MFLSARKVSLSINKTLYAVKYHQRCTNLNKVLILIQKHDISQNLTKLLRARTQTNLKNSDSVDTHQLRHDFLFKNTLGRC